MSFVKTNKILICSLMFVLLFSVQILAMEYKEAPNLESRVESGELPPVEERLPENPLIVEPTISTGEYGGTLKGMSIAPETWDDVQTGMVEGLALINNDGSEIKPNTIEKWEFSDDKKTLTIYMRKGMKWSDGHPLTADDILYWWEDMMNNKKISPSLSNWWKPGREPMKVEKLDDYTVEFEFAISYPGAPMIYASAAPANIVYPKHYLKQYHIKYNPDAEKLAEEEGFDSWYQLHGHHAAQLPTQIDADRPTLLPWVLESADSSRKIFRRNPYYWKVDTEGNQLPYIDKVRIDYVDNPEVANLKAISGDVDIAGMELLMENIPLIKQNESKGDYDLAIAKSTKPADISLTFNLNHQDPTIREIFQDVRFRRAASLAINRDEINQILFYGYGAPRQATVHPGASYFKEEWAEAYAEYDPERANELLDEMGLEWDEEHNYRLTPDGEKLSFLLEFLPQEGPKGATVELISKYWSDIGIEAIPRARERSFIIERVNSSSHDVTAWHIDRSMEFCLWVYDGSKFGPPGGSANIYAMEWGKWLDSGYMGTVGEGIEPPQDVKDLYNAFKTLRTLEMGSPEYMKLATKAFEIQAENLYLIGTVGLGGWPITVQKDLKNVIDPDLETIWFGADNWFMRTLKPAQWYLDR